MPGKLSDEHFNNGCAKAERVTEMTESDNAVPAYESAFLQANLSASAKLERARTELLDLSARNRLLNIPRASKTARTIEVIDEKSTEVFRILIKENRAFTFVPGRALETQGSEGADVDEIDQLAQPDDDSVNEHGILNRHADTKLQTRLTSKGLQKRLLDLYFDARTLEEEQGVNILFLALGTLKWIDPTNQKNVRYAPLILIPVSLERGNAAEQFKLKWRQEDHASNLSLEAFLDRVHGLKLPPFEQGDDFDPAAYLDAVARTIKSKENWAVAPDDIVLGFFSFSKFLMYRDLDPEVWPIDGGLTAQPLIRGLLTDGFVDGKSLISEDASIDEHILPADLLHIVDCDSSQTLAVHDVRAGRNLVIQGPPGTGKSQTIANVIASAIADGKTVLFVAEKMAALDVVKRRLDQAGVGDACLELHSNKANKRILLEELRRTSELGSPKGDFPTTINTRLQAAREALNEHAARMHKKHPASGLTPYQVIGQLTRLRQEEFEPVDIRLERPETWSSDDRELRERLIGELAQRITEIGRPADHPWRGIGLDTIFPTDVERLIHRIGALKMRLETMASEQCALAMSLDSASPSVLKDLRAIADRARCVAAAPQLSGAAITAPEWESHREALSSLIGVGFDFARLASELDGALLPAAWTTDVKELRSELALLPNDFDPDAFERVIQLHILLPKFISEAEKLKMQLGFQDALNTVSVISRELLMGERVAAAPNVSAEVFAASVWDHGVEQAGELAAAVATLEKIQSELQDKITDTAWKIDFSSARQILAIHGKSFFRFFRGDWRRANALVKSVLKTPDIPLQSLLGVLDSLATGQAALATVHAGDDFGRSAFGVDWRAERSTAAPLRALVEWMRSLRGLGAEPRLIASKLPDRSAIGERTLHVQRLLDEVRPLLRLMWDDCRATASTAFPDALNVEQASLSRIIERASKLYEAQETCKSIMAQVPPNLITRLSFLDRLMAAQRTARAIADAAWLGNKAFGAMWCGTDSDWNLLKTVAQWMGSNLDVRETVARHDDRTHPLDTAIMAERDLAAFLTDMDRLQDDLHTNSEKLFGVENIAELSAESLIARFNLWIDQAEQLSKWVSYRERADRARTLGLGEIVDRLENGLLESAEALRTFDMAYYEALFSDQVRLEPALARFDGQLHTSLVGEFVTLDQQRIAASSLEVVRAHHRRIPQGSGGVGPLGVLRGEIARRRGHMPIRQLMLKAAPAIQALKPVLMMSPLSVAQFLPPGQLSFDLLVMDEASQIQPVDALGAIARCRQVVVVGDERQLPPTKFFSKMTGGQSEDEDGDGAQVADIESILGLFTARGLPQRMLRWHYRSRHQSLIAVSNSQFYENKLFIVPSPYTQEAGMGLQFHHIADGIFDSGNTGINALEAKTVAEAIIRHAKSSPELSLGVATFSVKQRRAIQDQLELLRRINPDTEPFFHSHPSEPFFVKNLENVQGDERDVIFISVGYGRNAQGYMAMRFGPLSADGGERRLNVLISRAKRRCEVFASITDDDIDLERGKGKGVFAFKLFLHFARTGKLALAQTTGREYDSVFEIQVANAVQERGYLVHPQVGIAGFFIDLAIADANRPGRYLLGIECDGASYHRSRSARDRDRLRQAVLEDHGWIIHRIWSTDWFQRPRDQLQRVIAAIEAAKVELDARMETVERHSRAVPVEVVTIERAEVVEIGLVRSNEGDGRNAAYVEATTIQPVGGHDLHEMPVGILADLIEKIVIVESPVHIDEVVIRLRNAWGLKRAGARIQSAVERGVATAVHRQRLSMQDQFLSIPKADIVIRDRSSVQSETLRKPEMLPPQEIEAAILDTVQKNFGASSDEIVQTASRMFGFKATSSQLRDAIQLRIDTLVSRAILSQQGEILVVNEISRGFL
jgi:very-short-patch-repair endonuclease